MKSSRREARGVRCEEIEFEVKVKVEKEAGIENFLTLTLASTLNSVHKILFRSVEKHYSYK